MTSHCSHFQILSRLQWRMLALWIKIPAKTVLAKTNAMLDLPHVRKVPRTRLFQREELQQRAGSVDSNPGEVVVALCVTSQRADSPHFPKTWKLDISYLWFYLQVRFFFPKSSMSTSIKRNEMPLKFLFVFMYFWYCRKIYLTKQNKQESIKTMILFAVSRRVKEML